VPQILQNKTQGAVWMLITRTSGSRRLR